MRTILRLVASAALCSACDSAPTDTETGVIGTPGITIISGADVTDTVDAPAGTLVVEARTADGRRAVGREILFTGEVGLILVRPFEAGTAGIEAPVVTDEDGRAAVHLTLGDAVGSARVQIHFEEGARQFNASAEYVVEAGRASVLQLGPGDAVLMTGGSMQFSADLRDRHLHPHVSSMDQFTFFADSAAIASVSPTGVVTAVGVGRARFRAVGPNGVADTAWVSVPPAFTFAAITRGCACAGTDRLVVKSTAGVTTDTLASLAASADWHPTGDRLVFEDAVSATGRLFAVTPGGAPARLIDDDLPIDAEFTPQFSGDGQWLFFSGYASSTNSSTLWRAAADGSGAVEIGPSGVDGVLLTNPAPSHDGSRVAFVRRGALTPFNALFVVDVASGIVDSLAPEVLNVRWSPGDSLIAFTGHDGVLSVIHPDGTGLRTLGQPAQSDEYGRGIDWSPDGSWLLAGRTGWYLELIRLSDGLSIPLYRDRTPTDGMGLVHPVWRP